MQLSPEPIDGLDEEYQEWILFGAAVACFMIVCCPCLWPERRTKWCSVCYRFARRRTMLWVLCALVVDALIMHYVLALCPDWTMGLFLHAVSSRVGGAMKHIEEIVFSTAIIIVCLFLMAFRTHILKVLGIDHVTMVRFDWRDFCFCCYEPMSSSPIEVWVDRVDGLPPAALLKPNDLFIEFHLGSNEVTRTRVKHGAGEACRISQGVQLNFDESTEESQLIILAKHQDVISSQELARCVIPAEKLSDALDGGGMAALHRGPVQMQPQGQITLHFRRISDEDPHQTVTTRLMGTR